MGVLDGSVEPDAPRADSALVAAYTEAVLAATRPVGLRTATMRAARAALPDAAREALARRGVWDALDSSGPAARRSREAQRVAVARPALFALADVDPGDVRAVTAFYASEAGRYVGGREAIGTSRASLPAIVESLRAAAAAPGR